MRQFARCVIIATFGLMYIFPVFGLQTGYGWKVKHPQGIVSF